MKLLKLTNNEGGPIWINFEYVVSLHVDKPFDWSGRPYTVIRTGGFEENVYYVEETPKDIFRELTNFFAVRTDHF